MPVSTPPSAPATERPAVAGSGRSAVYGNMRNPSLVDFPGRMAAVLFTAGCNFRCGFCHNASLLGQVRPGYTWDRLDALCRDHRRNWVEAAVITGGEPTLAPTLRETIDFLRRRRFAIKLDTNGSRPEILRALLPWLEYVAMDVKCAPDSYPEFVGFPRPERIRDSIRLLIESGMPCEFRTTLVETFHTEEQVQGIGEAVDGAARFVVQAFIPRDDLPDPALRQVPRTTPQALRRAADILRRYVDCVEIRGD
ncbi:MAG: anaerobic ribonucleoside-triphosphate reductase activating protein [Lentisphaeria bacterium]|nr:anaerobic ribonucleoside-triphosphate reductase activating protein [Lentisphaeria bacterium]